MQTDLYNRFKNKQVMIVIKRFYPVTLIDTTTEFKGKVIGFYITSEGGDSFFELDNGKLINTRYIESIEVMD